MKFLSFSLIAFAVAFALPQAGSSQDTPSRLYVQGGATAARVNMAADSILKKDPANIAGSPWASEVLLKGNVEIRMCCVERPVSKANPKPARAYMIMHADEADYHGDTGEIEARGTVKVNFQDIQIQKKK